MPRQGSATGGARSADRYFTLNGARIRFRDEGRGPPVLLVHGWTLDLEMWDVQTDALRNAFRIIRLDRRGFGLSSGDPAADLDVTDLDALCRNLGLERIALIGMSQGARAVLGFAAARPERVTCVVLDGPPSLDGVGNDDDVSLTAYVELVRTQGIDAFRREWALHPLMKLRTEQPRSRQLLESMIRRYPGTDLSEPSMRVFTPLPAGHLESMAIPVLVLTGQHELPGRVQAADRVAGRLAQAVRAVVPDAGHLPNLDNPEAYNNLVRAFLNQHARVPA